MRLRSGGLWRHPDFVRLWAGQTVSVFGSQIGDMAVQFTALLWLGAGAAELAILGVCQLVPGFAVGLVAGVWADRVRRRPLMIAADIGRFVILATIPVAAVFDLLTIWQLYAVALAESTLAVFFDVSYEAYLPSLVKPENLTEGNAKLTASNSVAEIGSFSITGWLVQLLNGPAAVLIDSFSFLVSAFSLARIRAPEPPPAPPEGRESFFAEAGAGVATVLRTPLLLWFAVVHVVIYAATRFVMVAFLIYLVNDIGFQPGVLGLIFGIGGATSLVGAWAASRFTWGGHLGAALVVSLFIRAGGMLCMPLAVGTGWLGVAFLIANQLFTDPCASFYEIHEVSIRQSITEEAFRGRVNATIRFAGFTAMLLGSVAGGLVAAQFGAREALFACFGMMLFAAVLAAFSPLRRFRNVAGA